MLNNPHGARRRLVACGKVKSNKPTSDPRVSDLGHSQFAQLVPFLPLDEDPIDCGISFKDTLNDGNPQPPAVFELDPGDPTHRGNGDLCFWLKTEIAIPSVSGCRDLSNTAGILIYVFRNCL